MTTIPATGTLPAGWWMDEDYRAWVESEVKRLTRAGHSTREICTRLGLSGRSVVRMRSRPDEKPEDPRAMRWQWIADGIEAGDSTDVIADRAGVHPATVRRHRARMQA